MTTDRPATSGAVRRLWDKVSHLGPEAIRFGIVGLTGVACQFVVFNVLRYAGPGGQGVLADKPITAQVIAIGANYAAHASELKLRSEKAATVFSLWPNSLAGHGGTTSWPENLTTQVDYEAELGVIIGKPARDVSVRDALDYVWGYTVVNDITARDLQFSEAQWSRCKSFDGFTPNGPVVVTADEIPDPQDLWLTTNVDGAILQDASTADMVRSVAEIIEFLSRSATVQPGTLISTGSPGGAGYSRTPPVFLRDRSTVTVSIGGIGYLTTYCRVT